MPSELAIANQKPLLRLACTIMFLMAVLSLSGCFERLVYNNLPVFITWEIDSYFDLRGEQKALLKQRLKNHQDWHRQQEMNAYVEFVYEIKNGVADGINEREIDWFFRTINGFKVRLAQEMARDAAVFLKTLDADQIAYLREVLLDENNEFLEDYGEDQDTRIEERGKAAIKFLEEWVGKLSREQKDEIMMLNRDVPDTLDEWLTYRVERLDDFVDILESDYTIEQMEAALREWFIEPWTSRFSEYYKSLKDMVFAVDKLLTHQQRLRLQREIQRLVNKIDYMRQASVHNDIQPNVGINSGVLDGLQHTSSLGVTLDLATW